MPTLQRGESPACAGGSWAPYTALQREVLSLIEASIPAAGYATVGAFFELAQRAYDEPVGGCTPPPLVPMIHRMQLSMEMRVAIDAVLSMEAMHWGRDLDYVSHDDMVLDDVPLVSVPLFVALAQSTAQDMKATHLGVFMLRKLLDRQMPPVKVVVATGVVRRLVELVAFLDCVLDTRDLPRSHRRTAESAAWILATVSGGASARAVVDAGAVPHLIAIMRGRLSECLVKQSVKAIHNIASRDVMLRDVCIEAGASAVVAAGILGQFEGFQERGVMTTYALWAASSLCRSAPPPALACTLPLIPALTSLLSHDDRGIVRDAALALLSISQVTDDHAADRIQSVIDSGAVPRLAVLLTVQRDADVVGAALRALSSIATGTTAQIHAILDADVLLRVAALLPHVKRRVARDACDLLASIAAGTSQEIQRIMTAGLFPLIIAHMETTQVDVRNQVSRVIANATLGGTPQQVEYMRGVGAIKVLFDRARRTDARLIVSALEALQVMICDDDEGHHPSSCKAEVVACDGLGILRKLRRHSDPKTAALAASLCGALGENVTDEDESDADE